MKALLRISLATFAIALSPLVSAHALMVDSFPAKDQVLDAAPSEIHVTFNEHVEATVRTAGRPIAGITRAGRRGRGFGAAHGVARS